MKPGDLVKLVLPGISRWHAGSVVVSWQRPGGDGVVDAPLATKFPEGTLAVFLSNEAGLPALDTRILIEGRVGWVWSMYLEVV